MSADSKEIYSMLPPPSDGGAYNFDGRRPSAPLHPPPPQLLTSAQYPRRQSEPQPATGFSPHAAHYMDAFAPYGMNPPLHINTQMSPSQSSPTSVMSQGNIVSTPSTASSPMPADSDNTLQATWHGYIHSAWDAALIVEACLDGTLAHCPRRPHDRERQHVIKSGSVFVYEANASGIKRWTDGLTWSPSRINGNFLIYRELKNNVQHGARRRTANRRARVNVSREASSTNLNGQYSETSPRATNNEDRPYLGSLLDSYDFKDDGLVKKTISFAVGGHTHHVISYYTLTDAKMGHLPRPQSDPRVNYKDPRPALQEPKNFKAGPHHGDETASYYSVVSPYGQQQMGFYPQTQASPTAYAMPIMSQNYLPSVSQPQIPTQHTPQAMEAMVSLPPDVSQAQQAYPYDPGFQYQ